MSERKQGELSSAINVTPMADIMLVLLVIFMIVTPLMQEGVTVTLPRSQHAIESPAEHNLEATLTRDGRLFLWRTAISEDDLVRTISETKHEVHRIVTLRADRSVPYGRVVQLVERCRSAGVDRIALVTERESQR